MGVLQIPVLLEGTDADALEKTLGGESLWPDARKRGLWMHRVLVDPQDASRGLLMTHWESSDAIREFQSSNEGFEKTIESAGAKVAGDAQVFAEPGA